jgi:thiamine pyrophosphate-dependent acetolactate synthase large subunit-like protein
MNASQLLVDCLEREDVCAVAGVSGRPILDLLQVLEKSHIGLYQTRHEQGAGFLADGYARAGNRTGVVLVQRGPGVTNCVTPIANAKIDGIPLIVLIGQGEMEMFDKGALQELDHLAFLDYFCKWTFRLHDVRRIPEMMRRAFMIASSGKPGPVALELPMNLMDRTVPDRIESYAPVGSGKRILVDPETLGQAVDGLLQAESPVVYAGAGVLRSEASTELLQLAELLALPVMTSLPGKSCFPEDHPLSLGLGGFPRATYGTPQAAETVDEADWILALGCSFREHGTRYFKPKPEGVKLIQVDISEQELSKNYTADIAVLGDIKAVLQQMIAEVQQVDGKVQRRIEKRRSALTDRIETTRAQWLEQWQEHLYSDASPIDPYRITTEITATVDLDQSVILHDAGLVRAYICHHLVSRKPLTFLGYGGFSAMGYSLPAALGAKIAAPDKNVLCIIGDGSFGMTGLELETAVRYGIKTVTLVYNNGGLDAVRRLQERRQEPHVWDDLGGNYAEVARGLGAFSMRIDRPGEIKAALVEALGQDKPALLELMVQKLVPTPNYS